MKKYLLPALAILLIGVFVMTGISAPRMGGSPYASEDNALADLSGWREDSLDRTWSYVSANAAGNTFVVSATGDLTDIFRVSLRWRAKQGGGYEHFIIHYVEYVALDNITKLTVFGGASGDLIDAAITDVAFSTERFPAGFPVGRDEWKIEIVDTTQRTAASPGSNVYSNPGGTNHQISIAPGVWDIGFDALATITNGSSPVSQLYVALSTSNSSVSNLRLVDLQLVLGLSGVVTGNGFHAHAEDEVILTTETTYYLIAKQESSSTTTMAIGPATTGSEVPTVLYAVSGYY